MTAEIAFLFLLLSVVIIVFIIDKFRTDMVAFMVLTALALSGIITPSEAVSGFGNSVVLMIAALFIVGEALILSGVAAAVGSWLLKVGGNSEVKLLLLLLPTVALLSAFMSSTGAVALLIPVVLSIARKSGLRTARLLMPLAFAALMGGMLTLIGTPPNIVASEQIATAGLGSFRFFDFTPIGVVIFMVGMLYLIFIGRLLLSDNSPHLSTVKGNSLTDFMQRYDINSQLQQVMVKPNSPMIGCCVSDFRPRRDFEVTPFAVQRLGRRLTTLLPILLQTKIQAGDILWVYAQANNLQQFANALSVDILEPNKTNEQMLNKHYGVVEVLLPPHSNYIGKTLFEAKFREKYQLNIIALRRQGKTQTTTFTETQLHVGDTLLLAGSWQRIRELKAEQELIKLNTPKELKDIPVRADKAFFSVIIILAMLIVMAFNWLPSLTAVLTAAALMIITRCVTVKEAYASINAASLVLIAGMLPMALAMEKSGALSYVVGHLVTQFSTMGPLWLCAGLFLLTSVLSQFISNTATSVLLMPIALSTSIALDYQPQAFVMTVAIAASTAFATPIASPVNMLVMNPGRYRFIDFVKVGIPLQLLAMLITLLLLPTIFPFHNHV